jgi:nucleolar MIF4G domain-containing protein 1
LTIQAEQSSHRHKGHSHSSRKDARKQERMDRKKRKADHFSQTTHSVKRKTEQEHVESPQRKRVKISQESGSRLPASKSHHAATTTTTTTTTKALSRKPDEPRTAESVPKQKRGTTALERLVNKSAAKPRKEVASKGPRAREEEEEDAYIAYLESKLGYSGGNSRRKDDDMDGLGGAPSLRLLLENSSPHRSCTDLFDFTENIMTSIPVSWFCNCKLCVMSESPRRTPFRMMMK